MNKIPYKYILKRIRNPEKNIGQKYFLCVFPNTRKCLKLFTKMFFNTLNKRDLFLFTVKQ